MNQYHEFVQKLQSLLRVTFKEIENEKGLFEFGIYTDQDVTSILICYNTYSHFANQLKDRFLEYKTIGSHYRWSMPEWQGELGKNLPLMDEVNDALYRIAEAEMESDPDSCFMDKDKLLGLLYQALLEVKGEGLFKAMDENFIIYLEKGDSWINEIMRNRIKELIGEKYYQEFLYDLKDSFI